MKKLFNLFVLVLFSSFAFSQNISVEQQLIRTTGFTIHAAHKLFIAHGIKTGNLSKSIEHQRYAVLQFKTGNMNDAVYHSAYARRLAFSVIEANNGTINPTFLFTEEELNRTKGSPSDDVLEKAVKINSTDEDYKNPQLTGIDI